MWNSTTSLRKSKGAVTWTKKPEPPRKVTKYMSDADDSTLDPSIREQLVIGTMWMVRESLADERLAGVVGTLPLLSSSSCWSIKPSEPTVRPGEVVLYSGTVRSLERLTHDRTVNINRHTFIAKGTRYIIRDILALEPLAKLEDTQEQATEEV